MTSILSCLISTSAALVRPRRRPSVCVTCFCCFAVALSFLVNYGGSCFCRRTGGGPTPSNVRKANLLCFLGIVQLSGLPYAIRQCQPDSGGCAVVCQCTWSAHIYLCQPRNFQLRPDLKPHVRTRVAIWIHLLHEICHASPVSLPAHFVIQIPGSYRK